MIVPISIVIPIIKSENKIEVWVQKRETKDDLHGLLEFPGGKVERNEAPVQAAAREVLEETGVEISESEILKFKNFDFKSGDNTILLMTYLYYDTSGKFSRNGRYSLEGLSLMENEIPPKNKEIIVELLEYFR